MEHFEIKNRFTGAVIYAGEFATLKDLVAMAVKSKANLSWADLSWANLSWADLSWADLSGAVGVLPELCTPLLILLDQPAAIRAYKLTTAEGLSPFASGNGAKTIHYEIGKEIEEPNAFTDVNVQCNAGINLATLDWCLKEWKPGYRVLIAEFTATDIAAIPTATDGKFRVRRCRIVGEKDLTGLVPAVEEKKPAEKD